MAASQAMATPLNPAADDSQIKIVSRQLLTESRASWAAGGRARAECHHEFKDTNQRPPRVIQRAAF